MAENKKNNFFTGLRTTLGRGMMAYADAAQGSNLLKNYDDARAKLAEKAKAREQDAKIGSMLINSDDPDVVQFGNAISNGDISLKQASTAYNMMTKKDKSKSDIESLNELLTGMGVIKNVPSATELTNDGVVTKTKVGGTTVEFPDAQAKVETKKGLAKENIEVAKSRLVATYNLDVIGPLMKDYMKLLAEASKQGGSGNAIRKVGNKLAMAGIISGKASEKFEKSSAIPGKKGDIILKMFPMLTQQIGKEGTIRIVTTVLDMIGVTIPDEGTPKALVREPAYQTLLSLARMRKAIEGLNMKDYSLDNPNGQQDFAKNLVRSMSRLNFTDKEQKAWDGLTQKIFEPWDSYYTSPSMRQDKNNKLKTTKSGIGFTYREVNNG